MNRIDRHIFSTWGKIFLISVSLILGLLLLFEFSNNLKDLLEAGAGISGIIEYYAIYTPTLIPTVLPVALLISILFSLGHLHRNNEIIALQSAGLSILHITRALWLAGAVLSLTLLYLNASFIPWAVEKNRRLWESYKTHLAPASHSTGQLLTYYDESNRRIWFVTRYYSHSALSEGLNVSQLDSDGREIYRVAADQGFFDPTTQSWIFRHGRETRFDRENGDPVQALTFTEKVLPYRESPELMKVSTKRPRDLSFFELITLLQSSPAIASTKMRSYEVRYHSILANPAACLFVVGIGIPFAIGRVRSSPLVGVSKAVGLFAMYYCLYSVSTFVGGQGMLEPWLAAWLPNLVMLSAALVFTYRAT